MGSHRFFGDGARLVQAGRAGKKVDDERGPVGKHPRFPPALAANGEPGLLLHLARHRVQGRFSGFDVAADAGPFPAQELRPVLFDEKDVFPILGKDQGHAVNDGRVHTLRIPVSPGSANEKNQWKPLRVLRYASVMSTLNHFEKSRIALYYFMIGAGFHNAVRAMTWCEEHHPGFRKDGKTPAFAHQIWIANHIRTLPLPRETMELALVGAFLHDTREDKGVSLEEVAALFGAEAASLMDGLTKKVRGLELPRETYFAGLVETPLRALVKGVDRLHNLSSMVGVFDRAKQKKYIDETRQWHLPMLKTARRRFPEYEAAYENIKQSLLSRIDLIEAIHAASPEAEPEAP